MSRSKYKKERQGNLDSAGQALSHISVCFGGPWSEYGASLWEEFQSLFFSGIPALNLPSLGVLPLCIMFSSWLWELEVGGGRGGYYFRGSTEALDPTFYLPSHFRLVLQLLWLYNFLKTLEYLNFTSQQRKKKMSHRFQFEALCKVETNIKYLCLSQCSPHNSIITCFTFNYIILRPVSSPISMF